MINILKAIRNWLVADTWIFAKLGDNIMIGNPLDTINWLYAMINTIPTSKVKQVEESQLIEIRIIWTQANDFEELWNLQKAIRDNILQNFKSYWLRNLEIFNNSFWYTEQKRPWSVEYFNLKFIT